MNFEYELFEVNGVLGIQISPSRLIMGNYEPLNVCLHTDIRDDDRVLTWIDAVLSGKVNKDYCGGDIACAEFDKNQTEVFFEISPKNPARCTLPTWLFREIVEVWLKEAKKHFEETHKD